MCRIYCNLQRGAEWAVTGNVTNLCHLIFRQLPELYFVPILRRLLLKRPFANIGSYDIAKSTKYLSYLQSHIRNLAGDEKELLNMEKMMVKVLISEEATVEAKKLLLRELSWMGTDYSVPAIKDLVSNAELKDEAEFALARLTITNPQYPPV